VEMGSYGIGVIAKALKFEDNVVIIRIVTDYLADHAGSEQKQRSLLMDGRIAIARLILALVIPQVGT